MGSHTTPALWSLAAAALWVVLALNNPTVTYHVAPAIVAVAWILVIDSPNTQQLLVAAAGGLATAVGATTSLSLANALRGPDLAGGHAATAEAMVFAGTASVLGWAARSRRVRQTA